MSRCIAVDTYAYAVSGIRKLEPDPERQRKWIENVDTYTGLDDNEQELLAQRYPQEVTEMTGIIERARDETRQETRQEEKASDVLHLIERRFGPQAKGAYQARVEAGDLDQLERWFDRAIDAKRIDEVFTDN